MPGSEKFLNYSLDAWLGPKCAVFDGATWFKKSVPVNLALNGTNGVANPGFEVDAGSWTPYGSVTLTRDTSLFHSGAACGRVDHTGAGFVFSNAKIVTGVETITLECWLRVPAANSCKTIKIWAQYGPTLIFGSANIVLTPDTWTKIVVNGVVDGAIYPTAALFVQLAGAASGDVLYLDDASLSKARDFTVALWFRSFHSASRFVECYDGSGSEWWYATLYGAKASAGISDKTFSVTCSSVADCNDGRLHLLIAAFDRDGNLSVSVDGGTFATTSMAGVGSLPLSSVPLWIGQNGGAAAFARDAIGELQIVLDYAFVQADATSTWLNGIQATPPGGTRVAHYKWNNNLNDETGNNNLTLIAGTARYDTITPLNNRAMVCAGTGYGTKASPVGMDQNGATLNLNNDFEVDVTSNWSATGGYSVVRTIADYHSGVACAEVTGVGVGAVGNDFRNGGVTYVTGTKYVVEFWAKSVSGNTTLTVQVGGGGGNPPLAGATLTTSWQKFIRNFTGVTGTHSLLFFLAGDGVFRLDDVYLAPTNDFSIVGWFRTTDNGNWKTLVARRDNGSYSTETWMVRKTNTNKLYVGFSDGRPGSTNTLVSTNAINDGFLHSFAVTIDKVGSMTMYIDGVSAASPGTWIQGRMPMVGADYALRVATGSFGWDDLVGELQIVCGYCLTATEVANAHANGIPRYWGSGTVAAHYRWSADDGTDLTGNNNLTLTGSPTFEYANQPFTFPDQLTSWSKVSQAGSSRIIPSAFNVNTTGTGKQCVKMEIDSSGSAAEFKQDVTLDAGKKHTVRVYHKAKTGTPAFIINIKNNTSGNYLRADGSWGAADNISVNSSSTYAQYTLIDFVTEAAGTSFTVSIKSTAVSATLYFDDATLKQTTMDLAGQINGVGSTSGTLLRVRQVAGQIAGSSSVAGTISRVRRCAGVVSGSSSLTGRMSPYRGMKGTVAGSSAVSGRLSRLRKMAGTIAGQSSVSGVLKRLQPDRFIDLSITAGRRSSKATLDD